MRLYESSGKDLFKSYQIPVPESSLIKSLNELIPYFTNKNNNYFLKAQTLSGGRGKRGLIKEVNTLQQASNYAEDFLSYTKNGENVNHLLLEEKLEIEKEYYFSLSVDNVKRCIMFVFSEYGGVEVENSDHDGRRNLRKMFINPLDNLKHYEIITLLKETNIDKHYYNQIVNIVSKAYQLMVDLDATLIEINPLVTTVGHQVIAADAKIEVDDSALRKTSYIKQRIPYELYEYYESDTKLEKVARENGISYVDLDGEIAILSGGAGMTMAIIDAVHHHGGRAANFVDISSGSGIAPVKKMSEIIIRKANDDEAVKCILINIIISATPLDVVTDAMVSVLKSMEVQVPVVGSIRAAGLSTRNMSVEESETQFESAGVKLFPEIIEAINEAVKISKRSQLN